MKRIKFLGIFLASFLIFVSCSKNDDAVDDSMGVYYDEYTLYKTNTTLPKNVITEFLKQVATDAIDDKIYTTTWEAPYVWKISWTYKKKERTAFGYKEEKAIKTWYGLIGIDKYGNLKFIEK